MSTLSQLRERLRFFVLFQAGNAESQRARASLAADARLVLESFDKPSALIETFATLDADYLPVAVLCPGVAEPDQVVPALFRSRPDLQVAVITAADEPRTLGEIFRHRPVPARQVDLLPAVEQELAARVLAIGDAVLQRATHRRAIRRTSERLAEARPRALELTAESVRRTIMESLPTGLIVLNTEGYVVETNTLARAMLHTPTGAEGNSKEVVEHIDTLLPQWSGQIGTSTGEGTISIPVHEGTRYLRVRSARLGGNGDEPLGTLITLEDVTARARLEAEIAARTKELEEANARLEALSHMDPLTGIWNRRYFERRGCRELERADRNNTAVSVLMLDVDWFKLINDEYGHANGDAVLKALVVRLNHELRPTDMLARIGGEEFAALLPDCDVVYALEVAQRLRTAVANTPIATPEGPAPTVTISIGVAVSDPADHDRDSCEKRLRALMQVADRRLYQAKAAGRNRSVGPSPR